MLRRDVVEGMDIMVVCEFMGGIYFGKSKGFGVNDAGERIGFNTMVYFELEVDCIVKVVFEIVCKCKGWLCFVEKVNVFEVS